MNASAILARYLKDMQLPTGKVVDLAAADRLYAMDLTGNNPELTPVLLADVPAFSSWVNNKLIEAGCRYGIGGFLEERAIYRSRRLFTDDEEPRSIHLGMDIWAQAGTPVYAPLDGTVHSFADNDHYGDYGPTIILRHQPGELTLYSLYGHLNRACLAGLTAGQTIASGQKIGEFGAEHENGHWPPHLHFQLMLDMQGNHGDYPGVCRPSEKDTWLKNIADPNLLLQFPAPTYR